jgi:hypothetical protein
MKKRNGAGPAGSSIYAMWNKDSKAKKIDETSTPNQIVVESSASHDERVFSSMNYLKGILLNELSKE